MRIVIFADIFLRDADRRIGDPVVVLDYVRNAARHVGAGYGLIHFEVGHVHAFRYQRHVLQYQALLGHLILEVFPHHGRAAGCVPREVRHELAQHGAVIGSRVGIDERAADNRRDIRAVDHVDLLGFADTEACRLETGLERILADQKVPCLIPDLILFLGREAVASRGGLDDRGQVVDLVGELGISDFFPVDFSDAHLALLERAGALIAEIAEQEGQQGDSDDDRNDDAAASSQCVKCCHIGSIVFENAVSCWITKPKGNKILLCKCNPASETAILLRSTVRFVKFLACFRLRRLRAAATVRRSGFSSARSALRASIPRCRSADAPLSNAPVRHGSGPRPARPRGRFPLRKFSRGREFRT